MIVQYKCLVLIYVFQEIFIKQNYNVLSPNSHIHVSVSDLHIHRIGLPIFCCSQIGRPNLGMYINRLQIHECRNWE